MRGARRARMHHCISFAELSRPSVWRPSGGRDTVDPRPFCVCLGPLGQAVGPGFLGSEPAPHGTQLRYRTPRASTQAARVIGWDSFSVHPSFSFSLFLFNLFQSFCVTNKYKREQTYRPVIYTSFQKAVSVILQNASKKFYVPVQNKKITLDDVKRLIIR